MAVVRNLMVRAGADFSSMRRSMYQAQRDLNKFKNNVSKTMRGISSILAATGVTLGLRAATREAMNFEASLQQIQRLMGSSAGQFTRWADEQAAAFGFARSEAIRYGAVFANLLSSFTSDSAETARRTRDLLQTASIISSATGRTIEDVMDRIRSGMLGSTEAIEDLGVYVNISMIESTKAFREFAGDRSWSQLDFQTQQTIRYFAILEQAAERYGDELYQNTMTRQAAFVAQLKNARLALGQAFLPIYNVVLPALTRMATALASAMNVIAQFTQALFGGPVKQQTQATEDQVGAVSDLGDAYEEAGKKAKGAIAGFDQLNVIGQASSGAQGVANLIPADKTDTGALGAISESMNEVSVKAQEMAEKVREIYGRLSAFVREHSDVIVAGLAGVTAAFSAMWLAANGGAIAKGAMASLRGIAALANPMGVIAAAIGALVAAGAMLWQNWDNLDTKWKVLGATLLGGVGIVVAIGKNFEWLWKNIFTPIGTFLSTVFLSAWNTLGSVIQWVHHNIVTPIGNAFLWLWQQVIKPVADALKRALAPAFQAVADIAKSFWQNVLVPLGNAMREGFVAAVNAVSAALRVLWQKVIVPLASAFTAKFKPAIKAVGDAFVWVLDRALKPLVSYMSRNVVRIFDEAFKSIGEAIEGLKTAFIGLIDFLTGAFTGDWRRAWNGVKDIFKGVFDSLWGIVKFPLNQIIDGLNHLIDGLNKINFEAPDWVPFIGGKSFGVNIPKIPKLAKGGLAYGPTLAMVGDNPNARINPEVVAPLSDLKEMLDFGNSSEQNALLRQIYQAIRDLRYIQAVISESEVVRAAINGHNQIARMTGQSPLVL